MGTPGQDPKRSRDFETGDNASPAKRAKASAQQELKEQQASVLSVPASGAHIQSSTLLPALQQLLTVYKVEYWALLEELRAKRHAYCEAGRHHTAEQTADATANSKPAAEAAQAAVQGSMRELMLSLQTQPGTAAADADDVMLVAEHGKGPSEQQQDADAQQQQQHSTYGDKRCGYGKHTEQPPVPSFAEAEAAILQLQPGSDKCCATPEQLQGWHERFKGAAAAIAGLEQLASAATTQYMDAQGGLACLCGAAGRWVIRRTSVSIGRSSDSKGDVDVDLGKAVTTEPTQAAQPATSQGAATSAAGDGSMGAAGLRSVSRLQAQLSLGLDGCWTIRNTGRAAMAVNGSKASRGSQVQLPHMSLLELAGEPLLFMVNGMAVQRAVARSNQLIM